MLRPTPGDPWGVEQHHWNTGAEENPLSVKALVQADFPVYAQANCFFKSKQEKMAHFKKLLFCQKKKKKKNIFVAPNFFMQMFNESILCRQCIELFRYKLWYKLNSPHMHYLYTCHTNLLSYR